jgi:hypothetical protein
MTNKKTMTVLLAAVLCGSMGAAWAQGDAYEPDNVRSQAKVITNGETQARSIHAAGDADWVRFQVAGSGARNLRVETAGVAYGDTEVWLYNGSGALVAYDDDSGVGKYSLITARYLRPRTYFLKIQEYGHDAPIPSYQLQVNWTPVDIAPDAYEPDNGRYSAKTITNGQTQARTIHLPGNADWAKFRVDGDGARNILIETRGAAGDTEMWLYDANLRQLAYNDNGGPGRFSRIRRSSLPAGHYFIRVQEKDNDEPLESYTLKASWTTTNRLWPAEIDGPITWLHTDVSGWPVTARMTASVGNGWIRFPYSLMAYR